MPGQGTDFSLRLELAMRALNISRGALASEARVDKSLISRWTRGKSAPRGHNLAALTQVMQARIPTFNQLAWDLDLASFARMVGTPEGSGLFGSLPSAAAIIASRDYRPSDLPRAVGHWLSEPLVAGALISSGVRGSAVAGIWRTTRPSPMFPGRYIHDHIIMEVMADGSLSYRMGLFYTRLVGWAMVVGQQLYCHATEKTFGNSAFGIVNMPAHERIEMMDGIVLGCLRDRGGAPTATACVFERVCDLTGVAEADNATYEALLSVPPFAPDGSISPAIVARIMRDVGPTPLANGGEWVLSQRAAESSGSGGASE